MRWSRSQSFCIRTSFQIADICKLKAGDWNKKLESTTHFRFDFGCGAGHRSGSCCHVWGREIIAI